MVLAPVFWIPNCDQESQRETPIAKVRNDKSMNHGFGQGNGEKGHVGLSRFAASLHPLPVSQVNMPLIHPQRQPVILWELSYCPQVYTEPWFE